MLILTRKIDQGIVIAGNIYIRVLGVQRDRVKIGISAPIEIAVLREELLAADEAQAQGQPGEGKPPHPNANARRGAPSAASPFGPRDERSAEGD